MIVTLFVERFKVLAQTALLTYAMVLVAMLAGLVLFKLSSVATQRALMELAVEYGMDMVLFVRILCAMRTPN
jgi:hypothetical protein